jgi:hypothetical protein
LREGLVGACLRHRRRLLLLLLRLVNLGSRKTLQRPRQGRSTPLMRDSGLKAPSF